MPEQPRLGVSVVTFHSDPGLLALTVAGVRDQLPAVWRTHVHVNEATADELELVRAACGTVPGVSVEGSSPNHGFAGAHNASLQLLFDEGADAVLVLNPDLRLAPTALHALWALALERGGRCLVGPLLERGGADLSPTGLIDSAGIRWTRSARHLDVGQGSALALAPTESREVAGLTGACLLVTSRVHDIVVQACGEFFDEDFFAYREDAELALRAQALRIPSLLCVEAHGVHARGLPGTTRSASPLINRLGVQNRFLIRFKHGRRRPGNLVLSTVRDVVVLLGAALVERSSWAGVRRAWSLRARMKAKGQALRAAAP